MIDEIYEYDLNSTPEELDEYCRKADFVFNLVGVNRPEKNSQCCCLPSRRSNIPSTKSSIYNTSSSVLLSFTVNMPEGSFVKQLFSLYLSYLPAEKFKYAMKMNCDDRGSFTELVHITGHDSNQILSIREVDDIMGPSWNHIYRLNLLSTDLMISGWTHNIINLSDTEDLVTVMTCNEIFDPGF